MPLLEIEFLATQGKKGEEQRRLIRPFSQVKQKRPAKGKKKRKEGRRAVAVVVIVVDRLRN